MRKLLTAVLWPKRQPGKLYLPVGFILVAAGIIYTAALTMAVFEVAQSHRRARAVLPVRPRHSDLRAV